MLTIPMFLAVIAITLLVVLWAAKRTRTTSDFYTASSSITGTQNGFAIAGNFMSAASFLGVSGLISLFGFDGLYWAVGAILCFVTILLLTAEPLRNLGKYTLGDILTFRSSPTPVRATIALTTVILCIMYLITQLVAAGKLMQLLLDIPYEVSVIGTGILMIGYVLFGGMIATTWLQIIKACLLMFGGFILFILVAAKVGFNPIQLFADVVGSQSIQEWVQTGLLKHGTPTPGFDYGQRFLEPGLFMNNPWDQLSNCIGFLLGTAAMPHILMRFFTIPDAKAARKSVVVAMFLIGSFFLMIALSGFGVALFVTPQLVAKAGAGGNMANLLLAQVVGSEIAPWVGDVLLAFLAAVAFATILAVVSGVVLAGAGGLAHDVYVNIFKKGKCEQKEQMRAARIFAIAVGIGGIIFTLISENQNVAHLGVIAIILSLFWKKMSTAGIMAALVAGTVVSVLLVVVSPTMEYPKLKAAGAQKIIVTLESKQAAGTVLSDKETATLKKAVDDYNKNKDKISIVGLDKPLFPLKNPGLAAVPIGFLAAIIFSLLFPNKREETAFDEMYVRHNTGIGMAKSAEH
jgi:cation/acetate symporter